MKNLSLLLVLLISSILLCSQNIDIKDLPTSVKTKFDTQFPVSNQKDVKWGKAVNNYEAEFINNGVMTAAIFDIQGNLLEIASEFSINDLPKPVFDYLEKNYNWKKIKYAVMVVSGTGKVSYRIGIGIKELVLVFDFQGNFQRLVKM